MTAHVSAKDTARAVSKALGRTIDAKRVRDWVRTNVPAYDDDGYTSHQYDARTFAAIVKGMTSKAKTGRSDATSKGRTPAKTPTKRPAVSRVAPSVTAEATTPTVSKV